MYYCDDGCQSMVKDGLSAHCTDINVHSLPPILNNNKNIFIIIIIISQNFHVTGEMSIGPENGTVKLMCRLSFSVQNCNLP